MGFGSTMERAITNILQERHSVRYDPMSLWNDAKMIDEWPDTNPGDDNGTSVRAAYDVLRAKGPRPVRSMRLDANDVPYPIGLKPSDAAEGVQTNRWATTVDEIRTALASGLAVSLGISWYRDFDSPERVKNEYWIARAGISKTVRGGHCITLYGLSDRRQAAKFKNSWGKSYPLAWMPYTVLQRLLDEDGEACLVVDR